MPRAEMRIDLANEAARNSTVRALMPRFDPQSNWERIGQQAIADTGVTRSVTYALQTSDNERFMNDSNNLIALLDRPGTSVHVDREALRNMVAHTQNVLARLRMLEVAVFERTLANV
jgi:hypothetical protein